MALLLALAVSACARRTAPKPQQVVFWVSWPVSALEPLAKGFEAENPGIHVRLVPIPWQTGADTVAAALRGQPPDLCQLHAADLPQFLARNALSDWSAGVADLRAGLRGWEMCMVGDAIYGLPWLLRTQALFYDKALLQRAGIDSTRAPDDWEELRQAAARVQRLAGGVHGFGVPAGDSGSTLDRLLPFVWANDGDLLSAKLDSSRFDSPEAVAALEYVLSLRAVGIVAGEDSLEREFVRGRLGFVLATSELSARLAQGAPGLRHGVALVPRPAADRGTHASLMGGEVLVSFAGSRRKEDALRLARYLVRPENALALAAALASVQPATRGADTTAWCRARPEQEIMFRQAETARFLPNLRYRSALDDTLRVLWEEAIAGKRSAPHVAALVDTFLAVRAGRGAL